MTHFKNAATIVTISLLSAVPVAGFATETGSPQQSVEADPNEEVSSKKVTGESMEDTAKADQGENAYDDAEVVEDVDGSLEEDDAKSDS
ncbi:hypothetical protein [Sulfitobacter geojensis]|jgi:hypothetical protein|uniref:Uncharacterized protein n=1 Tax=Sulfitobacter geojensis TaxID=1342299 RepID=A0AAE2VUY7_9RHOB|nr:hypothetical protein [Sulfitobacter geojensis]KHA52802.1 hypothetical protein Z947_3112 [Sulfitobacter geojensis]MBM1687861.1 hypothetical protein [Sulfitobacter geojensis]MBM1691928.1 hypothetical protein [Sulfitobacter geojensis]MBM1704094.1 hypothetical protein [Sulfitobacter geojensis]MBM1708152.1 hypothetical protein [Sulfitobacter geojensis]